MNAITDVSQLQKTATMQTHNARELVKNGVQSRIVLDGKMYYLRITRAGKLILTK